MQPVDPFYFEAEGESLFANYSAPEAGRPRAAVALLYPLGHEYIRSHRAFRNLALSLSGAGVAVLRFDYSGVGDSSGESIDVRLETLQRDIRSSIDELKRRAGVARVSLVGLRAGAALGALVSSQRDDIDTLIAWDPVVSGSIYLAELQSLQQAWLRDRLGAGSEGLAEAGELLGMPVHPEFVRGWEDVDLVRGALPRARNLHILVSAPNPPAVQWHQMLSGRGVPATFSQIESAGDWLRPEAVHQLLLPHEMVRRVVALLAGD